MKTKILILHTSVGFGIKATAEAVKEKLDKDGRFEARIEDVERVESGLMTSAIRQGYLSILDHLSFLWGFLYNSKFVLSVSLPFRKFLASFKSKSVLKVLREFQPAVVVSTQTVPSGIIAYLKSKKLYTGKLVIVFSDYHLHRFWLYDEADLYICNIQEQVEQLIQLGVPKEQIALTGTIVFDKFFKPLNKDDARQELKLLTTMPAVILGGAGRARAANKKIFLQLIRSAKPFQVIVICGNNDALRQELLTISTPARHPAKILGYVNNMETLMAAGDVLVYKTGGPSMAEAVIKKLPMILTDVREGHELVNLEYLLKWQIVHYARNPREVAYLVEQVLDGKLKFSFQQSMEKIVSPKYGMSVVEAIERVIPQPQTPKIVDYQQTYN